MAEAHRLKLFATVEDGVVRGYGFFIGGGRPGEARLVIRNGQGIELFRGPTASDGSFTFRPAVVSDLALTIDAGDGHARRPFEPATLHRHSLWTDHVHLHYPDASEG